MAKAAKQATGVEPSPKLVNGIVKDVLECHDQIESARGKYMNAARRQRELMSAVYERGAAHGLPQRVMKLQIKIEQLQAKLVGAITELEAENRKMLHRVAKARGNKAQLALFNELPPLPKAAKTPTQADIEDVVLGAAHNSNGATEAAAAA